MAGEGISVVTHRTLDADVLLSEQLFIHLNV